MSAWCGYECRCRRTGSRNCVQFFFPRTFFKVKVAPWLGAFWIFCVEGDMGWTLSNIELIGMADW